MTIFDKVALEHNTTPEEVEAEIAEAIELARLNICAEDLIEILAAMVTAQQKSRG